MNYDPANIAVLCTANAFSSTSAIVKSAGEVLGIAELKKIDSEAGVDYSSHGFEVFDSAEYTKSTSKLQPGDILNADKKHIAIFVGNGEISGSNPVRIANNEIDDITINLDEQDFAFSGTPKNVTYSGQNIGDGWVFIKISEFIGYVVAVLTRGFLIVPLGWGMAFQAIVDSALKYIEGS